MLEMAGIFGIVRNSGPREFPNGRKKLRAHADDFDLWLQFVCPFAKKKVWYFFRSRYELVVGSEFHPRDESDKIDCGFLGPSWCNKKKILKHRFHVDCITYW